MIFKKCSDCLLALIVLGLADLLTATSAQAAEIDVYILAGQSNAAGRAQENELGNNLDSTGVPYDSYLSNSDVVLYANRERNSGTNEIVSDQPFGDLRVKSPFDLWGLHGAELSLARDLAASNPNPVAFVKYVLGGTGVTRWTPSANDLYPEFISYLGDREMELNELGHTVNWKGTFWAQGEADSFESSAPYYLPRFNELFDALRTDLGASDMPVVMAHIKSNLTDRPWFPYSISNPWSSLINSDIAALAVGDPTLAITGTTNDLLVRDGIHYTAEAYVELGHRLADTYNLLTGFTEGDLDGDGLVNVVDAGIMFANWGQVGLDYAEGNIVPGGIIDAINAPDAGVMFANWTGVAGPLSITTIPEPTTLTLATLALLGMSYRRKRA